MKVLIVAGGKGTRIKVLNEDIPKAMFPIHGKPVLLDIIEKLKAQDFFDIVISIGYLGNKIVDYLGNGKKFGVNIEYINETSPLGTGGAIKNSYNLFKDENNFLIIYGDMYFEMNLKELINYHISQKAILTFVVQKNDHPEDSSNVLVDSNNRILSIGRPSNGFPVTGLTRESIQVMNNETFNYMTATVFSFEDDLIPKLLQNNKKVLAYNLKGFIKDVGTPDRYWSVGGDIIKK